MDAISEALIKKYPDKKGLIEQSAKEAQFMDMLNGRFRDSGRVADSPGEYLDSVAGVPARTAIDEMQKGNFNFDALKKTLTSPGTDPRNAPTGVDLAYNTGIRNPYLGAAAATAFDVGAQVPVGEIASAGKAMPGIVGKVSDVAPEALLSKHNTVEKATALKGPERGKYLEALDQVYGDRQSRAKDMGFGDKTWYHGTSVPIDQFSNEAKGLSTNAQSAKKGFFFAQDPSTASDYADLAHEHGVIREGDNVTTKWNSDNHIEPDKLNFSDVDNARGEWRDTRGRTQEFLDEKADEVEKNLQDWEKQRSGDPNQFKWGMQSKGYPVNQEGLNKYIDEMQQKIADRYTKFYGGAKPATQPEIDAAKQAYYNSYKDYHATNPDVARKTHRIYTETKDPEELALLHAAAKDGADVTDSGGQNVLPVRLKGNPDTIHVKNYAGQGYRDTTYAEEMKAAEEAGKNAVLFKNTYDAADPNNKVRQNIAAVFDPNQIRSVNAAFDPRFADSSNLLAAILGANPIQPGAGLLRAKSSQKDKN